MMQDGLCFTITTTYVFQKQKNLSITIQWKNYTDLTKSKVLINFNPWTITNHNITKEKLEIFCILEWGPQHMLKQEYVIT